MTIEGPLSIGIVDKEGGGREIHLSFSAEFRALSMDEQAAGFVAYVRDLRAALDKTDGDERERAGMAMVLQIAEELQPHVASGDLALDETIVVEMQPQSPLDALIAGG